VVEIPKPHGSGVPQPVPLVVRAGR
jgi:hypothetical protein